MEHSKRELLIQYARKTRNNKYMFASKLLVLVFYCMSYDTIYDQYLSKSFHCYAFVGSVPIGLKAFSKNLFLIANDQVQDRAILLHSVNKKDDKMDDVTDRSNDNKKTISRISRIDPILVYTDIFAILIACQLMGLLDVLNDSTFWMNGGWFQPIIIVSTESSTLPIFLQRVASNTVCYVLITFIFVQENYEIGTALRSSESIIQPVSLVDYIGSTINHTDEFIETLRESYFMAITIAFGRLGLYKALNLL
jgi:hypothetical protein